MSVKSQKRKANDKRRQKAHEVYWMAYCKWRDREPSRWHIIQWLKWRSERPYKPKRASEYAESCDKYGHVRRFRPW